MRRIIIAPDSFKESLDAPQAASAIAAGFGRVFKDAEIIQVPVSDGGEGLVKTLVAATGGHLVSKTASGPLGTPVASYFGQLGDPSTCVVEMAAASGLPLVHPQERNPLVATTYGTGELIKSALDTGCKKIIIGIGGSATNDGGAGMARALGVQLLNSSGREIASGAQGLLELDRIDTGGLDPRLSEVEIMAAVDVKNPLYGPQGAAYVYGPQKGATPEMLPILDNALKNFAAVILRDLGKDVARIPGAGAAGGLGAGLVAFLDAHLTPGVDLVLELVGFEGLLKAGADLVVTGEGQINRQTSYGKAPVGVARLAKKYGLPVLALTGAVGEGACLVHEQGIDAIFSIAARPATLAESMKNAGPLLADAAEQCARIIKATRPG